MYSFFLLLDPKYKSFIAVIIKKLIRAERKILGVEMKKYLAVVSIEG